MPKGDKSSDKGLNPGFGYEKRHDFLRNSFQREEISRLNRAKADRNLEMHIQGLQSDFQRYHQQIESAIENVVEKLPEDAKERFSNALQGYAQLKKDFSDVIHFTNFDQLAIKPSDHFTSRLLELKRSARNKYEARLSDAVNQIRPLHQKLVHQMLLAKFHEAEQLKGDTAKLKAQLRQETTKSRDFEVAAAQLQERLEQATTQRLDFEVAAAQLQERLEQATAENQSFTQESAKQRSIISEMTTKMHQVVLGIYETFSTFDEKFSSLQEVKDISQEIKTNFDDYFSTSEQHSRDIDQTAVSALLNVYDTLRDKQQDIAKRIGNLETIKEQRLLQEQNTEHEDQKIIIREMTTKMDQDVIALSIRFNESLQAFQQRGGFSSQEANNISTVLEEKFGSYYAISQKHSRDFDQYGVYHLLIVYENLRSRQQDIAEGMGKLEAIEVRLKAEEEKEQKRAFGRELWQTLERAKPELPHEADEAFAHLEHLHREHDRLLLQADSSDNLRDTMETRDRDYIDTFKGLLRYLSPETLKDFENHDVEFVAKHVERDAEVWYPQIVKGENDTLQIEMPIPYPHGMPGLALRVCDLVLEVLQQKVKRVPSPEARAEVATRVFLANERLGPHKLARQGYEMAEMYYGDYESGLQQALVDKRIDSNTPKDELIKTAHEHARKQYLESIQPPEGIPGLFPTMQPGSYFEESRIWKLNEGQRPVEVGSEAFEKLMNELMERKKKDINYTLTVNIMPDKKILVQPFYTLEGLRSHHPINAGGKPTVWAGEIDIDYDTKQVLRIKDQSGHFRTFIPDEPHSMIHYALDEFQERGFNIENTEVQLTVLVGHQQIEYSNYRPLSLESYQPISPEKGDSPQGTTMEDIDLVTQRLGMAHSPIQFTRWGEPSSLSLPVTPRSVSRAGRQEQSSVSRPAPRPLAARSRSRSESHTAELAEGGALNLYVD